MKYLIIISLLLVSCSTKTITTEQNAVESEPVGYLAVCVKQGSAVLNGIRINLQSLKSDETTYSKITDINGVVLFDRIIPGEYDLIAEQSGFKKIQIKSIPVKPTIVSSLKLSMRSEMLDIMQPPLHWEEAGVIFKDVENFKMGDILCD